MSDRIIVLNDPVNLIDPEGLHPVIKLTKKLWGKVMPGRPPYKRPRVKVYGDENTQNYLKTKIFPDGNVESKINLKVPKKGIEKATDALKVGAFFLIDIFNPMESISGELGNGDYTGEVTWNPNQDKSSPCE